MHEVVTWETLKNGWIALSILLGGSIISVTVICERWLALRAARLDVRAFTRHVLGIARQQGVERAELYCHEHAQPLAKVLQSVFASRGTREQRERAYRFTLRAQLRELETYVPILGTVGSIAPFVGLFGTVVGIMKAFKAISANTGGGPEVVAAGIAEALFTTATGLAVAIPAVIAYNIFITRLRRFAEEIDLAAHETVEWLDAEQNGGGAL